MNYMLNRALWTFRAALTSALASNLHGRHTLEMLLVIPKAFQ